MNKKSDKYSKNYLINQSYSKFNADFEFFG